jgi:hypothetical protein
MQQDVLVTIATFADSFEAAPAKGALEAIGIRAYVPGESLSLNRGGTVSAELQVFERDRERANVELRRLQMRIVD